MKKLLPATIAVLAGAAFAHTALSPSSAHAQATYPSKPVRMLVAAAPGGNPDVLGRMLADKLTTAFGGKTFLIENVPGAGGVLAAEMMAKSPSDPHLLMLGDSGAMAINLALTPNISYRPLQDFTPITALATVATVLVVHPSVNVSTLADFIKLAKDKPKVLNYGSAGQGSVHHLTMEVFASQTGTQFTHLPYRGGSALVAAVLNGEVQAGWSGIPNVMGPIGDGKLKVLCISTRERSSTLPNVPTAAELGVKDFDIATMIGLQTTAGVSADIVARLQQAVAKALREPDIVARMAQLGMDLKEDGTANYARFMREDIARYADAVKTAGLKPGN